MNWGFGRLAGFEIGGRIGWKGLKVGADIRLIGVVGGGHARAMILPTPASEIVYFRKHAGESP